MNLKGNRADPSVSLKVTQSRAEKGSEGGRENVSYRTTLRQRWRRKNCGLAADIIIFLLNLNIHLFSCMSNDDDDDDDDEILSL